MLRPQLRSLLSSAPLCFDLGQELLNGSRGSAAGLVYYIECHQREESIGGVYSPMDTRNSSADACAPRRAAMEATEGETPGIQATTEPPRLPENIALTKGGAAS